MLHGFDFLRQQYSQLAKPTGGQQSAITTIQTLAERLTSADQTQAPVEDRRAAVLALKGLSRDHTRHVGDKALPALLISLQRDANDEELARALVECCITLCEVPPPGTESHSSSTAARRKQQEVGPPVGLLNTDLFLAEPGPLHSLLPLLAPDRAFYTRFASLQLLGSLLRNRPSRVQDHVLVAPGGCGAVLECLAEGAGSSAEIVRNEALLLLPHLVHGNADIQKLVAFEGAFEKLLDVCAVEGRIEGGVIVQDALEGLESLLRYNVSNQNYFRETLSIPMLAPLLFYPPPPPPGQGGAFAEQEYARQLEAFSFQEWDQQKLLNAKLVIGIIGMLVGGQGEGRKANQAALLQCGVTKCLAELALASTAPASLKAQSLHVLASLIRASRINQDQMSALHVFPVQMVPGEIVEDDGQAAPPGAVRPSGEHLQHTTEPTFTRLTARPATVALISTAVNGSGTKGGLGLRAAALSCFEAYVADNLDARLGIISTMTSPPEDNPNQQDEQDRPASAGSLLLEGLIQNPATDASAKGTDAYKYLISAMMFAHLVRGSETVKKVARQIAIAADGQVVKRLLKEGDGEDGDDDEDDDNASLIQVMVGNLTMAERELADAVRRERAGSLASSSSTSSSSFSAADWTRIMTGYLVVLSVWLFESPLSVRDFLSESATLQALIQPVAQSSGVDPLVQALAAFLLGVAYEFDTSPGNVAVTRATMHPILHSRIGADNFAMRLERLKDDARFADVGPDGLEKLARLEEEREHEEFREKERQEARLVAAAAEAAAASAGPNQEGGGDAAAQQQKKEKEDEEARDREMELSGMGHLSRRRKMGLWFDWNFVEFWRANSVLIQKTILVDPASSSAHLAASSTELLDAQRQLETARDSLAKQSRDIEQLERRVEELSKLLAEERSVAGTRINELETEQQAAAPRVVELEKLVDGLKLQVEESGRTREELERKLDGATAAAAAVPVAASIESSEAERTLKASLEAAEKQNEQLQVQLDALKREMESAGANHASATDRAREEKATELAALQAQYKEKNESLTALRTRLEAQEAELNALRSELADQSAAAETQKEKISTLSKELDDARSAAAAAASTTTAGAGPKRGGKKSVDHTDKEAKDTREKLDRVQKERDELEREKVDLAKENEDLLVLLEELSSKRKRDKKVLREKGVEVSEDEEEEEGEDDE